MLAGVLGQKQWQFDVYSKDVEFANKMESGGLPGRVHISQSTLKYLNGEFEVCDGDGASREEAIRLAGIKTFFIVRVLKPYPQGTLDEPAAMSGGTSLGRSGDSWASPCNGGTSIEATMNGGGGNAVAVHSSPASVEHLVAGDGEHARNNTTAVNSTTANRSDERQQLLQSNAVAAPSTGEAGVGGVGGQKSTALAHVEPEEYTRRLRRELLNRDTGYLSKHMRSFTLCFRQPALERQYMNNSDETAGVSLVGMPVTLGFCLLARLLLGDMGHWEWCSGLLCFCVMVVLCICCTAPSWAGRRASAGQDSILLHSLRGSGDEHTMSHLPPSRLQNRPSTVSGVESPPHSMPAAMQDGEWRSGSESHSLQLPPWLPQPILRISMAVQHNAFVRLVISLFLIGLWFGWALTVNSQLYARDHQRRQDQMPINSTAGSEFTPLPSLTITTATPHGRDWSLNTDDGSVTMYMSFFCILLLLGISVLKRISFLIKMLLIGLCVGFQCLANFFFHMSRRDPLPVHPVDCALLLLAVAAACLLINRQFEVMSRRLFLWQREVQEQKDKVADMKRKNEALVYNILPPHVASHFLGRRSRDEELYSKSYDCVGVLFAAMPNFTDFYTEESVNNQGLECLRFLNEVISDFDALLDQPRFKAIIKIKTIGPTYMAASGLNSSESEQQQQNADHEQHSGGCSAHSQAVRARWAHLATLTEFALTLKDTLNNINKESFNNFVLKMG